MDLNIVLKRPNKTYFPEEVVCGTVVVESKSEGRHDGICILLEGILSIQMSPKNIGLIESFVNSPKPTVIISIAKEISKSGKFLAGKTEYPFEIPLMNKQNKVLYETYHGNCIVIQYSIRCDVKRNLLSRDLSKNQEIFLEQRPQQKINLTTKKEFSIEPKDLQYIRERRRVPSFFVKGYFDSLRCVLSEPITGEICIVHCERGISSIELQLVRLESCGASDADTKDVSEIQNLQLCTGDIPRGIAVPIYMLFPRWFTCSTIQTATFKIEFELNLVIIFDNDHVVTETFPLEFIR